MRKEYIRKKVEKRLRRIANKEGITYTEVYKIFRSQFLFAKEKIEGLDKEWLADARPEELRELVFNFIYIGKIHSGVRSQAFGNNKNRIKRERDEKSK